MAIRVAVITLVNVDANGNVFLKNRSTINQIMNAAGTDQRVIPEVDGSAPNAVDYPTIYAYLNAESADGFSLIHIDQTYIITSDTWCQVGRDRNQ